MFTETLSMISQLEHTKRNEACDGLNRYYLTALGISRFIRIAFWMAYKDKIRVFWFLLSCDIVHTILMMFFVRSYHLIRKELDSQPVLAFSTKTYDNKSW